jgi:hypothetical protein
MPPTEKLKKKIHKKKKVCVQRGMYMNELTIGVIMP